MTAPNPAAATLLAALRSLDQAAAAIRLALGLHNPEQSITWFMAPDGERQFEVFADGYGKFTLYEFAGLNPHDTTRLNEAEYGDEEAAVHAARRLGEDGVSWDARDTPRPDDGEDDSFYLHRTREECVAAGVHLADCDKDGFCNKCGYQEA